MKSQLQSLPEDRSALATVLQKYGGWRASHPDYFPSSSEAEMALLRNANLFFSILVLCTFCVFPLLLGIEPGSSGIRALYP